MKKMTKSEKIKHKVIVISMIFIVIMFCIFIFWWVFPYKTISISNQPYEVITPTVKQGELMSYKIDYCKYGDYKAEVHKQFIDGIIYSIPDGNIGLPAGCGSKVVSIKVPKTLPVGSYKLKVDVSFQVNPIRTISNSYQTEVFSVVK